MALKNRIFLILFVFLQTIYCCQKEEQISEPNIHTLNIEVNNDSIYLNGNISISNSFEIDSLGFVISSEKKPDLKSIVIFADKHDEKGDFRKIILDKFIKDSTYYVRTIIQSKGFVYYGNELTFISKNLNLPKIDDFTPAFGNDSEYVKIYGSNFSNDVKDISVYFGLKQATVLSCSSDRILVKVPSYTISEKCSISVRVKDKQATSSKKFFLFGPVISDFSPNEGHGGLTITINGVNFSEIKWRNSVYLGTKLAQIIEASGRRLVVKTDLTGYLPGSYKISVIANDKRAVSDSSLKVISPWKRLSDLPVPGIAGAVTFRIKNKIYLCTGTTNWNNTGYFTNLFLEYDILTDKWSKKANFPGEARDKAVGFSIGEKGYVGLGETYSLGPLLDFWEYDPTTDVWIRKSDFPARSRAGSMSFSYENKGYVLMGQMLDYVSPYLVDFWAYKPESDSWEQLPDFISGSHSESYIAILNNILYVFGGNDHPSTLGTNKIWSYNFSSQEWKTLGTFSFYPVYCFYDNNKCYVLTTKNELIEFMPETGNTIMMPVFPGINRGNWSDRGSGFIFNNKIYFGAGSIGGYGECTNDFWSFDLFFL